MLDAAKILNYLDSSYFFRNFAIKDGEITPSRQKKETSFFVLPSTFRNFAACITILYELRRYE